MSRLCFVIAAVLATSVSISAHAQCPAVLQRTVCEAADPTRFASVLTGDQEPAGGESTAAGAAAFVIDRDRDLLSYRVEAGTLLNISGAHIHRGELGVPGPVVIDLLHNDHFVDGVLAGSVEVSGALLDEISANPSAFFINVHTPQFPQGAIRGQLNGRGIIMMAGELIPADPGQTGPNAISHSGVFSLGFVDDNPGGSNVRVDFDMMTDGISDFEGAAIREGTSVGIPDLVDLGATAEMVDGRVHGSARMGRDEMTRILANPSGFHLQFRSATDGELTGTLGEAVSTFVPVFGRVRSAQGNVFNSDLRLFNPGTRIVNVFIQFFPAGSTNALAGRTAMIRLAPGEAQLIEDAMQTLFGQSSDLGTLRVVTNAQVVVESEIMDAPPGARVRPVRSESHNPRFGQFVSGIASCHAMTRGVLTSLSASDSTDGFRTNLLLSNPSARSALARFELRDAQGRLIDSRTQRLGGNQQMLIPLTGRDGLFRNASGSVQNGIVTMTADTPFFFGGSVIQNASGEARFIEARDVGLLMQAQ